MGQILPYQGYGIKVDVYEHLKILNITFYSMNLQCLSVITQVIVNQNVFTNRQCDQFYFLLIIVL